MAKAFSVASWNVEHFKGDPARLIRVTDKIKELDPDIFALYEVEGKVVFNALRQKFPGYAFQITEGPQTQEILCAVRSGLDPFFTQKVTFKSANPYMRPGLLLTVKHADVNYNLLFLHLASHTTPRGMGLRDDMLSKAVKFRKTLNQAASDGRANYIFLGDLNTMGMDYPYDQSITADVEIMKLVKYAQRYYKQRQLSKTYDQTFFNGSTSIYDPGILDHVFAADHLEFNILTDNNQQTGEVLVKGWPEKNFPAGQDDWIDEFSDHALLYFEVKPVAAP